MPVNSRCNSVSAYLPDVTHTASVYNSAVCLIRALKALAYRVGRGAFRQRCVLYQLPVFYFAVMYAIYLKDTLSKCSGLVKNDYPCLRESLQIVRALYQYTLLARTAYSCKEAERYTDYQSAGTACHQEAKRTVDPCFPCRRLGCYENVPYRGQYCERDRRYANRRGINPRKAGNKVL